MSYTVWFTGLPNAGKTKLSCLLYIELKKLNLKLDLIDADIIRGDILSVLNYTKRERDINVRAVALCAKSLNRQGIITIAAANVSIPQTLKDLYAYLDKLILVYCRCPIEVLEARDQKQVYELARAGRLPEFPGISDIYHEPPNPEITVYTDKETQQQSLDKVIAYLSNNYMIPSVI
ncbi:adenylylsulfate kinase [Candidatus Magnetoovum chiemensis]|nr:adenylylsulfate kinase [Candidatus Magnetoovum chiemensis]